MTQINSDLIRDLSVKAVEDFLNNKTPLSQGIAKQASEMNFNSEQVKRAVEATNCIAYLKLLKEAEDRTFEFPVADYKQVLAHMVLPEGIPDQEEIKEIQASFIGPLIDKRASVKEETAEEFIDGLTKEAKMKLLLTESSSNKIKLDHLSGYSSILAEKLIKTAQAVGQDPKGLDKLASITDEREFSQLSFLISGEPKKYRGLGKYNLFKQANLRDVDKLTSLYKEAQAIVVEMRERRERQEKMETLIKEAAPTLQSKTQPIAAVARQGGVIAGSAVGAGVAKAVKSVAKAPAAIVKHPKLAIGLAAGPVLDDLLYDPGYESTTGRSNDVWGALHG